MLMGLSREAVRFWLCFDNQKKHSAFSANLCVLMGHSTKNVFSHYSVLDTVLLIYGEKTVKSPILCLQGTHSVVGDIKKSVITSYA